MYLLGGVNMYKSKNPMMNLPEGIAEQIEQVTEHQIDELILLVSRQFNLLRPEREGVFISLSQDPQKRDEELKEIIRLLRLPQRTVIYHKYHRPFVNPEYTPQYLPACNPTQRKFCSRFWFQYSR